MRYAQMAVWILLLVGCNRQSSRNSDQEAAPADQGRDQQAMLKDEQGASSSRREMAKDGPRIEKPYVRGIALTADGKQVLIGHSHGPVELWDFNTGKIVRELYVGGLCWAFSPDGRYLLSGWKKGELGMSDAADGKLIRQFREGEGGVEKLAISPDGKLAITGSWDGVARVWDLDGGKVIRVFKGQKRVVRCVAFSPDGQDVLVATDDGDPLRLWSLPSGTVVREFGVPIPTTPSPDVTDGDWYRAAAFSPTGRYVLSGGIGGVKLWEVATGKQVLRFHGQREVSSLGFTPDGKRAISGGDDGSLCLWDVRTGAQLRSQDLKRLDVQSVTLTPDGEQALIFFRYGGVLLWSMAEWKAGQKLSEPYADRH